MKEIISTKQLSKNYKEVTAVSEINLSVQKGEIYGFLGLNGAGKTTTIRMLLGMIKPSQGEAYLYGQKIGHNTKNQWNKVGYLVETPHAYPHLTVKENLHLIRKLRKIEDPKSVDQIISKVELGAYASRKAKNLSLGNKQRLGLAKAMIHHPEILILDEPTNGLDPAGIHDIREMLIDLAKNQGVTIFISSHILGEISLFATRIGIIHRGQLIQEINTSELDNLCQKQLIIESLDNEKSKNILLQHGIQNIELDANSMIIKDAQAISQPHRIANQLITTGIGINKLNVEEENLESYFLRIIKSH